MDKYIVISPTSVGTFADRLAELKDKVQAYLSTEGRGGRKLHYSKVFFSDLQNQHRDFVDSPLCTDILGKSDITLVEQPPMDNSKVSVLLKTSDAPSPYIFQSLRLDDEDAKGQSSYLQTMMLFSRYIKDIERQGLSIKDNLVRTWIYVADIDVNYDGVVRARNDIFRQYGLTSDTHYVASTGIGGYSQTRHATVAIDFLTAPKARPSDFLYLQALDHLGPTHDYGVAFERGTRLTLPFQEQYFISGTASIDRQGNVLFVGDVIRQTERLLDNIKALLKDGGAAMDDIQYFIIYLRDISDYPAVEAYMRQHYPDIPRIILSAKVCRPEWLIEMECVAEK